MALLLAPLLAPARQNLPEVPSQLQARKELTVVRPGDAIPAFVIDWNLEPLDPMHPSPKKFGLNNEPWQFPWVVFGNAIVGPRGPGALRHWVARFRVYSQERKETDDRAVPVTRMLLSLWDEARVRLNYDHSPQYDGQIVDVFLCWGGKPGGEQRFDLTVENHQTKAVDTIYIYDINSFKDPVEMAREVAHEYGHAVLPAIGGYSAPENWANGYLGEKLFLRWVREQMKAGYLTSDDAMGVTPADLDRWLAANVDPLVAKAAVTLPSRTYLNDMSGLGMQKYIGLALYADTILPETVFGRSMRLTGSTDAVDYPDALVLASAEPDRYDLHIPASLVNREIWVPLGKGHLAGAHPGDVKILGYHGDWAKILAPAGHLTVVNR